MEYQVEISKSNASVGSLFSLLIEEEQNLQKGVKAVINAYPWMKETERFPTMVYPQKDGMGVILAVVVMMEAPEAKGVEIRRVFREEGFKVSL